MRRAKSWRKLRQALTDVKWARARTSLLQERNNRNVPATHNFGKRNLVESVNDLRVKSGKQVTNEGEGHGPNPLHRTPLRTMAMRSSEEARRRDRA